MRRVFADSSVLIPGAGSRGGASRAVLTMAEIGLFKLVVSRQILDECEDAISAKNYRRLYQSYRKGNADIYLMDPDGSHITQLTKDRFASLYFLRSASDELPAWSPDGSHIAFVSGRDNGMMTYIDMNICVMDIKGSNITQLTGAGSEESKPSWSPDGQKMVFISPCGGNEDIYYNASLYLINGDGTGLTTLDASPGGNFDPAWTPDGKKIAFTSLRTGQMEIFTIDVDDPTIVTQLTKGASQIESRMPTWSPDSSQLVYVVKRIGVYQIWMMNADGTDQKQIVRSGIQYTDYAPVFSQERPHHLQPALRQFIL